MTKKCFMEMLPSGREATRDTRRAEDAKGGPIILRDRCVVAMRLRCAGGIPGDPGPNALSNIGAIFLVGLRRAPSARK